MLLQEYKSQREVSIHYPSSGQSGIEDNTHRYGVGWAELPNLPGLRLAADIVLLKDLSLDTPQTPGHSVGNQGNRLTLRVHNKVQQASDLARPMGAKHPYQSLLCAPSMTLLLRVHLERQLVWCAVGACLIAC
jgi:hypothetical protein